MLERGLLDEVRGLLDMGLGREHTSMQAIGYKELTGVILGETGLREAVRNRQNGDPPLCETAAVLAPAEHVGTVDFVG